MTAVLNYDSTNNKKRSSKPTSTQQHHEQEAKDNMTPTTALTDELDDETKPYKHSHQTKDGRLSTSDDHYNYYAVHIPVLSDGR